MLPILVMAGVYGIVGGLGGAACHHDPADQTSDNGQSARVHGTVPKHLKKKQVQQLLGPVSFVNLEQKSFEFESGRGKLRVETSLQMPLQQYILDSLETSTSRHIGIVAMDPDSGRVLAMVGFDRNDPSANPCVDSHFPAASVFKIVTAAAAIETQRFDPNTPMKYNGRKYTLYKSQLKNTDNKWTRRISLKDSFAQSVNPVFGKIGALYLKKKLLETYGQAFGFNHEIDFEIPVAPSALDVSDDPYHWAEIASGFNRSTRISPLHGAIMASTVLNQGRWIEPTIVDAITDKRGRVLYRGRSKSIRQTLQPDAATVMHGLMAETIRTGTCRKIFRGYRRDKVLSRLHIGGKTGSIHNETHETRYDWFVGFAKEKKGKKQIVISAVVAHEKYIGVRAGQYAKKAIKQYFKNHFAQREKKEAES